MKKKTFMQTKTILFNIVLIMFLSFSISCNNNGSSPSGSCKYDTSYVKRYTFDSIGNPKIAIEKIVYRKVFKK